MIWYQYVALFFGGAFFSNAIPHFVQGVSGNKFPTPFAKPPGRGLSSATLNVVWGLINFIIAFVLLKESDADTGNLLSVMVFFLGFLAISLMSSNNFQKKDKE